MWGRVRSGISPRVTQAGLGVVDAAGVKRKLRSLVVDDEPVATSVLAKILSVYGPTDVVHCGVSALALARAQAATPRVYDLICLDMELPDMRGTDILREIRAVEEAHGRYPGNGASAVVMVTSDSSPQTVMRAFKGQADRYLVKPISRTSVVSTLRDLGLIEGLSLTGS